MGGNRVSVARFLAGRHALIPWKSPEDIAIAAEVCQSFILDNSAFSFFQRGEPVADWSAYYEWVAEWMTHPGFDWALIPDVITGDEKDNDRLVEEWKEAMPEHIGVPVWHFHEPIERLVRLAQQWSRVALGSSGKWKTPNVRGWWNRAAVAMRALHGPEMHGCPFKLHGLRMLNPEVFTRLPLSSADSTSVAQNANLCARFGQYVPPNREQRAEVIAARVESQNSMGVWLDKSPDPCLFEWNTAREQGT